MRTEQFEKLVQAAETLASRTQSKDWPLKAIETFVEACRGFVDLIRSTKINWMTSLRMVSARGKAGLCVTIPKWWADEHGIHAGGWSVHYGEFESQPDPEHPLTLVLSFQEPKSGKDRVSHD